MYLTTENVPVTDRPIARNVVSGTIAANTSANILRHIAIPLNTVAVVVGRVKAHIGFNGNSVAITSIAGNVATLAAHGLVTGQPILLGGGAAPTGLVLGTTYYAISLTANTFSFASTPALAFVPTAISLSSAGTTPSIQPVREVAYFEPRAVARNVNGVVSLVGSVIVDNYKDTALAAWASTWTVNNSNSMVGIDLTLTGDVNIGNAYEALTEHWTLGL